MAVVLQGRTARRLVWATVASIILFTVILYALLVTGPTWMAIRNMREFAIFQVRYHSMAGFENCDPIEECFRGPLLGKAHDLGITLTPERIRWEDETLILDYTRKADLLFFRYDWSVHEEIRAEDALR